MSKQGYARIGLFFLLAVTLAFIWGNSILSHDTSSTLSSHAFIVLTPYLEIIFGRGHVTPYLIRKLAHFLEFALLGTELSLILITYKKVNRQGIANCLFAALSTAVIDESIQLFSGRGPAVKDILIDFAGASTGFFIVMAIYWLCLSRGKNRPSRL